jgi:hypothetical protein
MATSIRSKGGHLAMEASMMEKHASISAAQRTAALAGLGPNPGIPHSRTKRKSEGGREGRCSCPTAGGAMSQSTLALGASFSPTLEALIQAGS